MDDAEYLEAVRDLVEQANANQVNDAADLEQCIRDHDLVFGVWQEEGAPGGVGTSIIKGKGPLESIKRTGAEMLSVTAVRCRCARWSRRCEPAGLVRPETSM